MRFGGRRIEQRESGIWSTSPLVLSAQKGYRDLDRIYYPRYVNSRAAFSKYPIAFPITTGLTMKIAPICVKATKPSALWLLLSLLPNLEELTIDMHLVDIDRVSRIHKS